MWVGVIFRSPKHFQHPFNGILITLRSSDLESRTIHATIDSSDGNIQEGSKDNLDPIVKPKYLIHLIIFNIHTLYQITQQANIIRTVETLKTNVHYVPETRILDPTLVVRYDLVLALHF